MRAKKTKKKTNKMTKVSKAAIPSAAAADNAKMVWDAAKRMLIVGSDVAIHSCVGAGTRARVCTIMSYVS